MELLVYLTLLVLVILDAGEGGGHGGKHHDHVKLHMPEFIHHDHHTKVITIHHHHHKPKEKHHHHHHHHHHKPHVPHGHHYHHHKKSHTTHTVSKGHGHGHGHHGHHGHHHGHHKHHGHHGHHGHGHHHHDTPSYSYDPTPVTSFEDDFGSSYSPPAVPSYGGGIPHVHGVQHTVKHVKVFDTLPGALPSNAAGGNHGYEVTEQGAEDEDAFTAVNQLPQTYPATYEYLRGAAPQPSHDPFAAFSPQSTVQSQHNPFTGAYPQPTVGLEAFTGTIQSEPYSSSAPTQGVLPSAQSSPDVPTTFTTGAADGGFTDDVTSFVGSDPPSTSFLAGDKSITDDAPVSFSREAGIQQIITTGGHQSVVY